ncbi:MAG: hypothetical protein LUF87_02625 [Alistipes sp.]|nr:hypothetical protein [Alistipes sp.]
MKTRNPILFSFYLTAAPAVILSVGTVLVYAVLKLAGGDLLTLHIAVPYVIFYYILAAPVFAIAGFLYMAAKNPQWN